MTTPSGRPQGPRSRLGELIARRRFPGPEEDVKALDRLITATRREVDQLAPASDPAGGKAAGAAEAARRWPTADQ
jgi:hypothetical protein